MHKDVPISRGVIHKGKRRAKRGPGHFHAICDAGPENENVAEEAHGYYARLQVFPPVLC